MLWLLGTGLVVSIATLLVLPHGLAWWLGQRSGFPCSVGWVSLEPLSGTIELGDVRVFNREPYPEGLMLHAGRLRLSWALGLKHRPILSCRSAELVVVDLEVTRIPGNHFNLRDFVRGLVDASRKSRDLRAPGTVSPWVPGWSVIHLVDLRARDTAGGGDRRMLVRMDQLWEQEGAQSFVGVFEAPVNDIRSELRSFFMLNYLKDRVMGIFGLCPLASCESGAFDA